MYREPARLLRGVNRRGYQPMPALQTDLPDTLTPLTHLDTMLGVDVYGGDYGQVLRRVQNLNREERDELRRLCETTLEDARLGGQESIRIPAVRLLVALLPDTLGLLSEWLQRRTNAYCYEVHFTLFCYLDWVSEMPAADTLTQEILARIENYLMTVKSRTASAAWMAGDLLGDHWNVEQALPTLLRTATAARYVAGRYGSLVGLETMLARTETADSARQQIRKRLRSIRKSDRSEYIRWYARSVLARKK